MHDFYSQEFTLGEKKGRNHLIFAVFVVVLDFAADFPIRPCGENETKRLKKNKKNENSVEPSVVFIKMQNKLFVLFCARDSVLRGKTRVYVGRGYKKVPAVTISTVTALPLILSSDMARAPPVREIYPNVSTPPSNLKERRYRGDGNATGNMERKY